MPTDILSIPSWHYYTKISINTHKHTTTQAKAKETPNTEHNEKKETKKWDLWLSFTAL